MSSGKCLKSSALISRCKPATSVPSRNRKAGRAAEVFAEKMRAAHESGNRARKELNGGGPPNMVRDETTGNP
jgi:hypothetical protein